MNTFPREGAAVAPSDAPWRGGIDDAREEVSASSAGGAGFLFAFGLTIGICAWIGTWLPVQTAAIILLFQGNVALPLAFWLERRLAMGPMARSNPLRSLSIQLAVSQVLGLPAAFIAYSYHPSLVPAALAAIAGAHFVPYAWLQRTRAYVVLAVAVSIGSLALTLALKRGAFSWVCLWMSFCYIIAAFVVRAAAARHVARRALAG
jgi:hypothetical protein